MVTDLLFMMIMVLETVIVMVFLKLILKLCLFWLCWVFTAGQALLWLW